MSVNESVPSKSRSLLRSTSIVSFMTFLSRMMGFVRDMIIAQLFGVHAGVDAFLVAFKIPNFMRRLFAEGAFSQAFVPVLAEYQKTQNEDKVREFISHIAGNLVLILSVLTIVAIIITPILIVVFAPGFKEGGARHELAAYMLKITFPYLMLISLTAMAGAVLNTYNQFAVPAFTPVLLNISMILAAVYLAPMMHEPVVALAWGVLIAGIIQLLFQLPFLMRLKLLIKPRVNWQDKGVVRVLKLMVPALFGVSIAQVNLLIDTIFASFLAVGSVSWLYFSDRLTNFPLGVFGVAIATVILPHLSRKNAEQNNEKFSDSLDWGMRLILLIGLPSAVGLCLFAMPLIASLLAYGKFSFFDLTQTTKSLKAFAIGVPAFMLVKILASGFYAKQNIKTPVKVGAVAMLANTILCFILIIPLKHAGLALASSIASYLNCVILLFLLIKRAIYMPRVAWVKYLLQLLLANISMACYLIMVHSDAIYWLSKSLSVRISLLIMHISIAMLIYLGCLLLFGVRVGDFRHKVRD
jgi:putative peptidoglycan lipid II flippase